MVARFEQLAGLTSLGEAARAADRGERRAASGERRAVLAKRDREDAW